MPTLTLDFEAEAPLNNFAMLKDAPRPNSTRSVPRSYYRCADCLSVVTTAARHHELLCGACEGKMEWMGDVVNDANRLSRTDTVPACDARCTSARGPKCVCKCQCENHGSGLSVAVTRDLGPIPVAILHSTITAKARAQEYRTARAEAIGAVRAIYGRVFELKKLGQYLGHSDWADYRAGSEQMRRVHAACSGRTHDGRLRALRLITERLAK